MTTQCFFLLFLLFVSTTVCASDIEYLSREEQRKLVKQAHRIPGVKYEHIPEAQWRRLPKPPKTSRAKSSNGPRRAPTPDEEDRFLEHQPTPKSEKTRAKSRAAEKRPNTSRAKSAKRRKRAPTPDDDYIDDDDEALAAAYLDVLSWPEATDELQIPTTRSRKRKK